MMHLQKGKQMIKNAEQSERERMGILEKVVLVIHHDPFWIHHSPIIVSFAFLIYNLLAALFTGRFQLTTFDKGNKV